LISNNANLGFNITNCRISITDLNSSSYGELVSNYKKHDSRLLQSNELISNDDTFEIYYHIPGRFDAWFGWWKVSTVSTYKNGSNYNFEFNNVLSPESCEIDIR
jgi:hypothetical protein